MSRSPIQVPDELKEEMEAFKEKLHAKSLHELISLLMKSHTDNERLRREEATKKQLEKERQQAEMVQLGEELKKILIGVGQSLEFRSPETVIEFLIEHYKNSDQIDKATFNLYKKLQHRG